MRRLDGKPKRHTGTPRRGINVGENNPAWKGGRRFTAGGYWQVRSVGHPRATKRGHYVFEHIVVAEKSLGRYLNPGEIVHHRNEIKTDNRIENLEVTTQAEHMRTHYRHLVLKRPPGPISTEHRRKISEAKKLWWKQRKETRDKSEWSAKYHP